MEDNIQTNDGLFNDFTAEDMPTESESVEETETNSLEDNTFEETTNDTLDTQVESIDTQVENSDTPDVSVDEPFLQIKYDKEEIGLSKKKEKKKKEKGKNYERLYNKYNSLNEPIERLARLNGMDVNTFLSELNNSQFNLEVNKEMQNLKNEYPTTEEGILKELASKRVTERISLQEQKVQEENQRNEDAQKSEILRQLDLFRNEFPDLEPDKLDPQVYEYVKGGYTLLEAYNKWARGIGNKNQAVRDKKAQINNLNEANKNKSLGNTSSVEGVEKDAFLSGFLD